MKTDYDGGEKPLNIEVTRQEGSGVGITFRIRLPEADPRAQGIYDALGKFLREIFTREEATEFLRQLEAHREALARDASA